jgi:hypothetical protein
VRTLLLTALSVLALATPAAATPVALSSADHHIDLLTITPRRTVWVDADGIHAWSAGHARVLVRPAQEPQGISASSTLVAWKRVDMVGDRLVDVLSMHREVLLPSGRVVRVERCARAQARCGCAWRDDAFDTGGTLAVDGDIVAVGRTGCRLGLRIFVRHGDRLRLAANLPRVRADVVLAGRYLAWTPTIVGRRGPVTLYDWKRRRVVRRFDHLPLAGGYRDLTLNRDGAILARVETPWSGRAATYLLRPDGRRTLVRRISGGVWDGPDRLVSAWPGPRDDAHISRSGAWSGRVVDFAAGTRHVLPVAQTTRVNLFAYDARCLAWVDDAGTLWAETLTGRATATPACRAT